MTRTAQSGSSPTTSTLVIHAPEAGPAPGAVSGAPPAVIARPSPAPPSRHRYTAREVARIYTNNYEFGRAVATMLDKANQFNVQTRTLFTEGKPLARRYLTNANQLSEFVRQIQAVANSPSNSEVEEGKRKLLAQIATTLTDLMCRNVENVKSDYLQLAALHKESNDCATQIDQVRYNAASSNFVLGSDAASEHFNAAWAVEYSAHAAANAAQTCRQAIEDTVNELRVNELDAYLARLQVQAKGIMQQLTLPQHEGGPSIARHEQPDDNGATPGAAVAPSDGDALEKEEIARRRRNNELAAQFAPRHPATIIGAAIFRKLAHKLAKMGIGPSSAKKADT
jgi:hypothetical protein